MTCRRTILTLIALALTLCIVGCSTIGQADKSRDRYGRVELLRDKWGVPHVFAKTDTGAMYGLGYATAEDRAFQMYYNLRIIQGRLAELIGDAKVGVARNRPQGKTSALRHDIEMRTIGYYAAAQNVAAHLDAESLAMLRAYSDGVNDYIRRRPNDLLYLFDELNLEPEPWTPAACIASWWRIGLFFSGDGLREATTYYDIKDGVRKVRSFPPEDSQSIVENRPIRDDASVIQRDDVTDQWVQQLYDYANKHNLTRKLDVSSGIRRAQPSPRFSHAWVVGKNKTTNGSAVLVSDPQTPVRNPSLFHEFHICGKTFNARGIGVAGSPNILIGYTPNVAWGLTALGADQADLFMLKTDPNRPNQYLLDAKWRDMQIRPETIQVKNGRPRNITYRGTAFGPVVTPIAMGVKRGDEVALKRIPICESTRDTLQGVLAMMRSRDVYELQEAIGQWRFPSANCVFGDSRGNIGYKTILALPIRSDDALLDGMAAHDGSTSKADWQGYLPHELLPQIINPKQGWLVSANHRPIASFYPIPMGISTGSLGDTDRSWRLKELVAARDSFTPEDVLAVHYDTTSSIKRDIVNLGYYLLYLEGYPLEQDTLNALDYLRSWWVAGGKSDMSIKGTEILNIMPMAFRRNFAAAERYGGGLSGLCNMLQTINKRIEQDPEARIADDEAEYINLILRAAWRYGESNYGDDPNRWHEIAQQKLIEKKLGYFSTLDGFESLDAQNDITLPPLKCVEGGTILSQKAQSYTQYVPLKNADQAMALLPPGQSEHPNSPHHLSGYELWSNAELRPAPLSRKAVEPHVTSRKDL